MVNYANGKIYKIEPIVDHDEGEIYIGSTTKQYLSQRMDVHRKDYKRFKNGHKEGICTVCYIFDKYGLENCKIILLETVNVETKDALTAREQYHIKNQKCVNKNVPGRSPKEYYIETNYYELNKERISNACKEYYEINKENVLKMCKAYREKHADEIKQKAKHYRENNKFEISERKKQIIKCECGSEIRKADLQRHKKSDKHKKLMAAKQQEPEAEN